MDFSPLLSSEKRRKQSRTSSSIQQPPPGSAWLVLLGAFLLSSWTVYDYQYNNLPPPLAAEQAENGGFSETEAMKHVKALTELGPHSVGSDSLDVAVKYVLEEAKKIKETAASNGEVNVEVELFQPKSGANRIGTGLFKGKTLVYSDLKHVLLRISPKSALSDGEDAEEEESAILVSAHIDTVFSGEGAGDDTSSVAVVLELSRGISQSAKGLKNDIVFLFNTGEEEGLDGSHSFITQHPWNKTLGVAVDLEALGIGGKSSIFQAGPSPWSIENFASAAKYPSGNIVAQDLFSSGAISSATDFQVYKEIGGLSGLDFAFTDHGAVYHTKNDKFELLKPGSLQHLGENMMPFLLQTASSADIPKAKILGKEAKTTDEDAAIYFDILGLYMVLYKQSFASKLYNSVIMFSLMVLVSSILMGGFQAAISLVLSCLGIILMWVFSVGFSASVAFILPRISPSPLPFVASPWLVVGLFAAPAILGAVIGQHLGFLILQSYLSNVSGKRKDSYNSNLARNDLVNLDAEGWLVKAGFVQWLLVLIVGNYYKIGSSYLALFWLVPPAFAHGLLEVTMTLARLPSSLKLATWQLKFPTVLIGLAAPIVVTAGVFIRLPLSIIGTLVRFDTNPGSKADWLGSLTVAIVIAVFICLTWVYILPYIHLSGAKQSIVIATSILFGLSLASIISGKVPAFTEETARLVNVVHVEEMTGFGKTQVSTSYISLFSTSPGDLIKESDLIDEGFQCGRDKPVDFVTFEVQYGCFTPDDAENGSKKAYAPSLHILSDTKKNNYTNGLQHGRTTQLQLDSEGSVRWVFAVNTDEIEDFTLADDSGELIPAGNKTIVDGWHIVQFTGGKNSPTEFKLTLFWAKDSARRMDEGRVGSQRRLLKFRTDFEELTTPKLERVLTKLPSWCALYGKSTSPKLFSYLLSVPIDAFSG